MKDTHLFSRFTIISSRTSGCCDKENCFHQWRGWPAIWVEPVTNHHVMLLFFQGIRWGIPYWWLVVMPQETSFGKIEVGEMLWCCAVLGGAFFRIQVSQICWLLQGVPYFSSFVNGNASTQRVFPGAEPTNTLENSQAVLTCARSLQEQLDSQVSGRSWGGCWLSADGDCCYRCCCCGRWL